MKMSEKPPLQFWIVVHTSKLVEENEPYVDISRPFATEKKAEREVEEKKRIWKESHEEDEELDYEISSFEVRKIRIRDYVIQQADRQDEEEHQKQMEVARAITKGILEDSEDNGGDEL